MKLLERFLINIFLISNSVGSVSIRFHLAQYFILGYGLINTFP